MQEPVLTSEERHRLLAVLRELDVHAPPEKRRHPRRKVRLSLPIRLVKGRRTTTLLALLINVAPQGVGLQIGSPLNPGAKFLLPLRFSEGGGWLVLCQVRNSTPCRNGFKIGAQFLDHIDDPTGTAKPPLDWLL